ncbi:MAG: SDR family oxidoreductase [Cyclobacteriaceae bacterium]|nr:SDR family oxidoreductase [Cyclobacteriaceae bacterium]MCH8516299.1 SDR family oxidoreductase [Cyclobacteriaceae bacterium]
MRVLLTGATGYVGKRLFYSLIEAGYDVYPCVRDSSRLAADDLTKQSIEIVEADFLDENKIPEFPKELDVAFYLIHSMSMSGDDFDTKEKTCALNFRKAMEACGIKQVIYLGGIVNDEANKSKHLRSREEVGDFLKSEHYALTNLRAGIVVGSGSASFEIIRDLVDKLPLMIAPKWLNTRCQPIGIRDVLSHLIGVIGREDCYNETYDIGGPDILKYRDMLMQFAEVRGFKRYIYTVPVMSPRLSGYWLYFITRTSYQLATHLVDSMKAEVVCNDKRLEEKLQLQPMDYRSAVRLAFSRISQNKIPSSWKDALSSSRRTADLFEFIEVPDQAVLKDFQKTKIDLGDKEHIIDRLWKIGGDNGWYHADFLWKIRGIIDKFFGGVGLRRGRTHPSEIKTGDALDFWRVLYANKDQGRLLLFAEMKLPGEAWLEFRISEENKQHYLEQRATFRPKGWLGRLYWLAVLPLHAIIFRGMLRSIVEKA